jgi:hypothetical protein
MPVADYEELSLDGMNIDAVQPAFSVLQAKFGGGYRAGALVGPAHELQSFVLSAGVLPDDEDYGNLIESLPRFQYYYEFWKARMAAGNEPFLVEHRGLKYTVVFKSMRFDYETFTADLFAGGVELEQCRVVGESYESDGSITP